MAWMLIEELLKNGTVFVAGFLLKGMWRAAVSNTIKGDASTCIIKNCQRLGVWRGLCPLCFNKAVLKVGSGETTWDELVSAGLCKAEVVDPFDDAYSKAMDCRPTRVE